MRKHRLRNKIKSIVGSLIDPDKDEELKGSNIETEDNYKKIRELLKGEDQDDKTKLVELIEGFHKRYQSIYQRYDHVTGKLREKLRSEKENDSSSSSSSSDSDSDASSNKNKNENENGNTETEILKSKLAVETQENEALRSKCQETEKMLSELRLEADRLHEENSKLVSENNDFDSKLENARLVEDELSRKIQDVNGENLGLTETIEELRSTIIKLKVEKDEIEKQKQNLQRDKVEFEAEIEFLRDEVENKNAKLESSATEMKRLETMVKETESEGEKSIRIIDELEETIEDLKSDLEHKGDEVSNLEVKLRLANQKLRVTEQTLTEQETDHAMKEAKLHQENKLLLDKISTLSDTITAVKLNVQEKVNEALTGIDSLTVKFEEDYGHVQTRVFEIVNEIKAVRILVGKTVSENEDLMVKVGEMEVKLTGVNGENGRLTTLMAEMEKRNDELGDIIRVKDEGILDIEEEKREAIRQLCMWVEYQRERCGRLEELLLKRATITR